MLLLLNLVIPSMSLAEVTSSSTFRDIQGHWAKDSIDGWVDKGLVNGYSDGTFKPNNQITRAEFMTLTNKSYGFEVKTSYSFSDVPTGAWYADEIAKARAAGYMTGYQDGSIKPNHPISRQEVAAILLKLNQLNHSEETVKAFADAAQIPQWSQGAIGAVVAKGYMKGYPDKTFQPTKPITRAEAIVTLDNAKADLKTTVTYNQAGTYGPEQGQETIDNNVVVSAPGVTLQNVMITGNLVIAESVGNGDVHFNNVTVQGTTTVKGGGENSIYFKDSTISSAVVNKKDGAIRLIATGKTEVGKVTLQSGVKLEEKNVTGAGFTSVLVSESTPKDSTITLMGGFSQVEVQSSNSKLKLASGSIEQVVVSAKAKDMTIEVADDAKVKALTLDAAVKVTGKGTIDLANINVSGTVFDKVPTKVVKPDSVTYEVKPPAVGGGGGGGGGVPPAGKTNEQKLKDGESVTGNVEITGTNEVYGPATGTATVTGNLTVRGEGNTLRNVTIQGNLIVSDMTTLSALLNEFTANNVQVNGTTQIDGGSSNTVKFANSNLSNISLNKPGVRLALTGNSSVSGDVQVNAAVTLEVNITGPGTLNSITVNAPITLQGNNIVITGNFVVNAAVPVNLYTPGITLTNITVNTNGVTLTVSVPVNVTAGNSGVTPPTPHIIPVWVLDAIMAIAALPSVNDLTLSDKPAVDSARALVNAAKQQGATDQDITNLAKLVAAEAKMLQLVGDIVKPIVTSISFGDMVSRIEGDTFAVDLRGVPNHYTTASITVSEKSKLHFDLGGLGTIGTFGLKEGANTISDIDVSELDLSGIRAENVNFTQIFNVLRDSHIDRNLVFEAVNYSTIFDEVKKAQIGAQVIEAVDFTTLIGEIKKAQQQSTLFDQLHLSQVFHTIKNSDINAMDIYNAVDYVTIVNAIRADTGINQTVVNQALAPGILVAYNKGIISFSDISLALAGDLTAAFHSIKQASLSDQKAIYDAINLTLLFEELVKANPSTKTIIFDAINFTQVFNTLKGATSDTKLEIFNAINFTSIFNTLKNPAINKRTVFEAVNFPLIFGAIQSSSVNRVRILNAIDLKAIFDAFDQTNGVGLAVFRILAALDHDQDPNVLTMNAILRDDAGNTSTYVLRIQL
ncbi:S-layer homology domain-containing protein [Ammoniphilus sp. YIM 78166]|uniref:S-layer homology domain-containing protein n=1 Tax=Ammoniphilus sp. YIM 78166 TaxID=1644106 RepID=UPI001431F07D|nr:S-layer homology domain-containing protein [Ammoniphilus sp. YIM 78166]